MRRRAGEAHRGRRARRLRDERGATAIFVALVSTVLFSVAALSVDLGQLWAQRRTTQTQADLAAISAANWGKDQNPRVFPATTPASRTALANKVAEYLNNPNNRANGQTTTSGPALLANTNGWVSFNAAGDRLTVVAPPARVNYGFAQIFAGSGASVNASATVQVASLQPPGPDLVPFWIPQSCGTGALTVFGGNVPSHGNGGGGGAPRAAPAWATQPRTAADGTDPGLSALSPASATVNGVVDVTMTLDNLQNNVTSAAVTFALNGTSTVYTLTAAFDKTSNSDDSRTIVLRLDGTTVTKAAGTFTVTAAVHPKTSNSRTFTVTSGTTPSPTTPSPTTPSPTTPSPTATSSSPTSSPTATSTPTTGTNGCGSQVTGNFGQLLTPRGGADAGLSNQRKLAMNLAEGVDHAFAPLPNTPFSDCTSPPRSAAAVLNTYGEQLDNVSQPNNNCITGDGSGNGNDGPYVSKGLVQGAVNGAGVTKPGRVAAERGDTRSGCHSQVNDTIGGVAVNNDVLSCYLTNSTLTLGSLNTAAASPVMLDQAVTQSPRFIWLPVVPATSNGWKPIKSFVPAFITDETSAATTSITTATANNGIYCNGNRVQCNSIDQIKAFVFSIAAIADDGTYGTVSYDAGLVPVVRLVD